MKAYLMPMLAAAVLAPAGSAQAAPQLVSQQITQQPREQLTLAKAVQLAQHNNKDLQVLSQEAQALQARVDQARLLPNPTLEYLREGRVEQGGTSSVQVAIPIELGGKRGARVDTATAELRVTASDLAAGHMRIKAEVIAAFHEVYLAEKRLALASQTGASAAQSTNSAKARVAAGKISPVEETRAKVAQANLQLEAIQARRDVDEARIKLALLCGLDTAQSVTLAPPDIALPAAPTAAFISDSIAATPSMQRAAADLDWRAAAARLERAKRYPDIALIVGKKREGMAGERQTMLGLSVPLPLFDRNQGAVIEADRRIDKSRAEMEANRARVRAEAALASARLSAALEQERILRDEILPGGQSAYAAASKGFDAGKFSFLEVLDAQRTYFQAEAQHLRSISEAHRAAADLTSLIGPVDSSTHILYKQDAQ